MSESANWTAQPTAHPSDPADTPPPGYFVHDPAVAGNLPAPSMNPPVAGTASHQQCPACGAAIPAATRYSAKTSGLAISTLVCGVAGFLFIPACVALGLGIGALGIIKHTGEQGRALAIAGIAVSGFWLALWALILILP